MDSIRAHYGGKKSWLLHIYTSSLLAIGSYDRFITMNWGEVRRLVFVCKGNICRSPYCEMRARSLGVNAISRGLEAESQGSTDKLIRDAAALRGVHLAGRPPMRFRLDELQQGDLIIVMEPAQASHLEYNIESPGVQITLLGIWHPKPRPYIQDPYGMPGTYVDNCLKFLDTCTEHLTSMVRSGKKVI